MQAAPTSIQAPESARLPLVEFILLMAFLTSLVALSIDAMLPALDKIGAELNSESSQQTYLLFQFSFWVWLLGKCFLALSLMHEVVV